MAALAPPVQVVESGAPPFVHVPSGAPPFVKVAGNAPPITLVASGAPPITLLNEDGSIWSAHTPAGGEVLLVDETDGFAVDFTHPVDGERVAVKIAGTVVASGTSFFTSSGTSSKWVYDINGTLVNIPVGTLPLDYDPVTHAAKGLLVEPAATNLMPRSSEFNDANWTKGSATIGTNAIAAPDGTTTADALIPNNGSVTPYVVSQAVVSAATAYTVSMYVKNGTLGTSWFEIALISGTTWRTWFNLSTGVKGSSLNSPTSWNISSVGNGWYRVDTTVTTGTTSLQSYLLTAAADGDFSTAITGNGTSPSHYMWGAQFEAGTVATSPIPTAAASVTRAADLIKVAPASINHSATAGSWWVDLSMNAVITGGRVIGYETGSNAPIYLASGTNYSLFDPNTATTAVASTLGAHRLACAFQTGDRAITSDGQSPGINITAGASGLQTPGTSIGFGSHPTGGNNINGYFRQIYYLPRRMLNAEMTTETAL